MVPLDQSIGTFSYKYSAQNHDFADTFTGSEVFASTGHHVVTCSLLLFVFLHSSEVCFCIQDSIGRICSVPLKRANEIIGATTEELVMKARQS